MFFVLTLFLPTRVLFFQVEGNETIPRRQILEAAAECGIRFGASRSRVRSEKMKNALLAAMPQLKWAGINTSGCTAVISVRERQPEPRQSVSGNVSSIAACRDGYITSCTVTKGNLLCAPGQIVQAGQVLISGFTDCGICIQATQAQGEIYAQTRRELTLKWLPLHYIRRSEGETRRRYSLILGKNRINLWKGSGISGSSCGRMYEEYYITLPGGFRLPIRIGVETLTAWSIQEESLDVLSLEPQIQEWARQLTLNDAVAGRILGETHDFSREGSLRCHFLCEEMIGRVITEEIGEANGKTD